MPVYTAHFYFERLLPRTCGFVASLRAGTGSLMAITEAQLDAMY